MNAIHSAQPVRCFGRIFPVAMLLLALLVPATPALAKHDGGSFLGITSRGLSGEEARDAGLSSRDGVILQRVYSGTAAEAAGLEDGDILLRFGDEKIFDDNDLTRMIRSRRPGDAVAITLLRDTEEMTVEAVLGTREEFEAEHEGQDGWSRFWNEVGEIFGRDSRGGPRLGVQVEELGEQLAAYFEVDSKRGLLLTHIVDGSPAEAAGLEAGDVVIEVDGSKVRRAGNISRALRDKFGETVSVTVVRRGEQREISVTLEDE